MITSLRKIILISFVHRMVIAIEIMDNYNYFKESCLSLEISQTVSYTGWCVGLVVVKQMGSNISWTRGENLLQDQ